MAKILVMEFIVPDSFEQVPFEQHIREHFWQYVRSPQILKASIRKPFKCEMLDLNAKGIDVKEYDF